MNKVDYGPIKIFLDVERNQCDFFNVTNNITWIEWLDLCEYFNSRTDLEFDIKLKTYEDRSYVVYSNVNMYDSSIMDVIQRKLVNEKLLLAIEPHKYLKNRFTLLLLKETDLEEYKNVRGYKRDSGGNIKMSNNDYLSKLETREFIKSNMFWKMFETDFYSTLRTEEELKMDKMFHRDISDSIGKVIIHGGRHDGKSTLNLTILVDYIRQQPRSQVFIKLDPTIKISDTHLKVTLAEQHDMILSEISKYRELAPDLKKYSGEIFKDIDAYAILDIESEYVEKILTTPDFWRDVISIYKEED